MGTKQERILDLESMSDELIENIAYEYYYEAYPDGDARYDLWPAMIKADRQGKINLMVNQASAAGVKIVFKALEEMLPT